ncbi:MAG: FAD-dependent oxidoreductase [Litorimonas sp.]
MATPPHIAIVGAGLIGLSSADELLRRGARITLIESRETPMQGASHANSGMIHPSQACAWAGDANDPGIDKAVHALAVRSRDRLAIRVVELGLTAMARRAPGCFQLFESQADADSAAERLSGRCIPVETVPSGRLPFDRPALFYPDDRSGDAHAYGQALLASVLDRGATLLAGQKAALSLTHSGVPVLDVGGLRIDADQIVLAAGSRTPGLLKAMGLTVPITPVRGWAVDYLRPEALVFPSAPVMDALTRSALTVFGDTVRLSGTWGTADADGMVKRWSALWPELMETLGPERRRWSGLRPVSETGQPMIGETRVRTLWINAGHGHMGWTLCAGSAEVLADAMAGKAGAAAFSPTNAEKNGV